MRKPIISALMFAALLVFSTGLPGCTRMVTKERYEITLAPRIAISDVTLTDSSRVTFDSSGARYLPRNGLIKGAAEDGTAQKIRIKDVDSVFYSAFNDSTRYARTGPAFKQEQQLSQKKSIRGVIRGLSTRYYDVIFDQNHGQVDTLSRAIVGVTDNGYPVSVPIDSVYCLWLQTKSPKKTVFTALRVIDLVGPNPFGHEWEGWVLEGVLERSLDEAED